MCSRFALFWSVVCACGLVVPAASGMNSAEAGSSSSVGAPAALTTATWYALTVDTAADTVAADGKCSLREAVAIVNRVFDANNDCPLVASPNPWDTIGFDAALGGTTITLTSNVELVLNATAFVTIRGPSANLASSVALDGNNGTRIFDIAAGANITLQYLSIQHGKTLGASPGSDGGAVRNGGVLSADNCTFRQNTSSGGGGAIDNEGALTLSATTFSNNNASSGGAILDRNTLSIAHGYIANNNSVGQGGGLDLRGQSATLTYTTVQNNTAGSTAGGGIYIATNGTLSLIDSLVAGNHVTGMGGGIGNYGQLSVNSSTFSGNTATALGGGISNDTAAATTSPIVASTFGNNSSGGGNAIANLQGGVTIRHSLLAGSGNCTGAITDAGANIAGDATCGLGATSLSMTDPQLGPLAYYGGPTWTMPPAPTSPALDVLNASDCDGAIDVRGIGRPQGGKCDIGAVELETDRIFPDGFDLWP